MREAGWVVGHICKHQPFFVIIFAEDFVVAEVKPIADTKPGEKVVSLFGFLGGMLFIGCGTKPYKF